MTGRVQEPTPDVVPGLVSVIIATYNCGQYVGQAVESVLAQTYPLVELHVVDDGSTDATAEQLAPFLGDRRVHYHYQSNAGQTSAKNYGIRCSRGEFIAFCDADDMWLPEKLELQMPQFAANDKVGVVYSRAAIMDERGARLAADPTDEPARPSGNVTDELFRTNFVPFGTAVIRRRCLETVGVFNEQYRMGIDWDLWLRTSVRYQFQFVDKDTYVYRRWSGQMSRNWQGRYEYAFRIMNDFLARHPGVVAPAIVTEAFAHSYTQRARLRTLLSGEYWPALGDLGRALRLKPAYGITWRTLSFVVLTAAGLRRPWMNQAGEMLV